MDARGARGGQSMLARARDRRKSARRRTGYDRDRVDARYRIADDRGAWERGAAEPRSLPRPDVVRSRSLSQTGRPERAARVRIIAPRRTNSAHLRRPRRGIWLQRRPRWRVRLQAGLSQPRRVAVAPNKNIENNPMQSSRRAPARRLWGVILDTSGKSTALLHHRTIR